MIFFVGDLLCAGGEFREWNDSLLHAGQSRGPTRALMNAPLGARGLQHAPPDGYTGRMPIKFRCSHCRQLLGIARSKAGDVVDCPTCGRAIRVPQLDGRLEPVPLPALDLQDSRLVSALNELAAIGDLPDDDEEAEAPPAPRELVPIATAEPIELDPLPALEARSIALASVVMDAGSMPADVRSAPEKVLGELAQQVQAAAPARESTPSRKKPFQAGGRLTQYWLTGLVSIVALTAGIWIGRSFAPQPDSADAAPQPGAVGELEPTAGISGRITFESDTGSTEPDDGAIVIALPRQGTAVRQSAGGLRPGDAAQEFERRAAVLAAAGGAAVRIDARGEFRLALAAGTYDVLVVSRHQSREAGAPGPEIDRLALWFDKPAELTGQRAALLRELRFAGTGAVLFDHVFLRSGG